jgi:hypothetical protein
MESSTITILLSVGSGLFFLAYRHPDDFQKISKPLGIIIGISFNAAMIWDMAISEARFRIISYVASEKYAEAKVAFTGLSFGWTTIGLMVAACAYVGFLEFLPDLFPDIKKKPDKKRRP